MTDIIRGRDWRKIYNEQLCDLHPSRSIFWGDQIRKNEMGGLRSTYGETKRCEQCSGSETFGKEQTWKA